MRDGGYAWKTEKTCFHWIRRFVLFYGERHPATLSAEHVEQYLSHPANERQCSPATQHIALNALVFLFVRSRRGDKDRVTLLPSPLDAP